MRKKIVLPLKSSGPGIRISILYYSNVNVFMLSFYEPKFIEKILWKSFVFFSFFQILVKIEMTQNEIRLFARHFETVQHSYLFFWKC